MKVEKLAAMAEIVSSVAIVATLVYLAIQTQQNTNALLMTSQQVALQSELDWLNTIVAYPEVLVTDPDDLARPDQVRLQAFGIKLLRTRELNWIQYQNGLLDESTFQSYLTPLRTFFSGAEERMRAVETFSGNDEFKAYLLEWLEERP